MNHMDHMDHMEHRLARTMFEIAKRGEGGEGSPFNIMDDYIAIREAVDRSIDERLELLDLAEEAGIVPDDEQYAQILERERAALRLHRDIEDVVAAHVGEIFSREVLGRPIDLTLA